MVLSCILGFLGTLCLAFASWRINVKKDPNFDNCYAIITLGALLFFMCGVGIGISTMKTNHLELKNYPQIDSVTVIRGNDTTKTYIIDILEN